MGQGRGATFKDEKQAINLGAWTFLPPGGVSRKLTVRNSASHTAEGRLSLGKALFHHRNKYSF